MSSDDSFSEDNLFAVSTPLSRLLGRLGHKHDPRIAARRAAAFFGAIAVVPPFVLAALGGTAWGTTREISFVKDIDTLARLAVAVPLFVMVIPLVGAKLADAIRYLEPGALFPDDAKQRNADAVARLRRGCTSRTAMLLLAVVGFAVSWTMTLVAPWGVADGPSIWIYDSSQGSLSAAGWWYSGISRPLTAFLILLWAWRYILWSRYLRTLGRSNLRLLAAHPDLVGGLAPVVRGHLSFALAGFAINVMFSGAIANELLYRGASIGDVRQEVVFLALAGLIGLLVPLAVLVPGLIHAKDQAIMGYGRSGYDLTLEFDKRWSDGGAGLLDTDDSSAMADFDADYAQVRALRLFPVGLRQLGGVAAFLVTPFACLSLTQVSIGELLRSLAEKAL